MKVKIRRAFFLFLSLLVVIFNLLILRNCNSTPQSDMLDTSQLKEELSHITGNNIFSYDVERHIAKTPEAISRDESYKLIITPTKIKAHNANTNETESMKRKVSTTVPETETFNDNQLWKTETDNDTQLKKTERAKDNQLRKTETVKDIQVKKTETVNDNQFRKTETVNDNQLWKTETANDNQLRKTETVNDNQLSKTETVNDNQLKKTGTVNDSQLKKTGTVNDTQLKNTKRVNDNQLRTTETVKYAQVQKTEKAKDNQLRETEKVKDTQVKKTETVNDNHLRKTETVKDTQVKKTEKANDNQLRETEKVKDTQVKKTETVNDNQLKKTETANDNQLRETETVKDTQVKKTERVNDNQLGKIETVNDTQLKNDKIIKFSSKVSSTSERQEYAKRRFGGFQIVSDNMTYVYAAYHDRRDKPAHIKVIAIAPKRIQYNFTCILHYPDKKSSIKVTGRMSYIYSSCSDFRGKYKYDYGYIICPIPPKGNLPPFVSIYKQGSPLPGNNIAVWSPSQKKNKMTHCFHPFVKGYNNVQQLVWHIELLRIYGVDKFVFYLENQSPSVENVLRSYEKDGLVELRNFTFHQPRKPVHKFVKREAYWGQFIAINDCLLSQIDSAKYILFIDFDEVVVPRKHKNLVEMADDLFYKNKRDREHGGSLLFKNVYYPTYVEKTKVAFPQKELALKYNIEPLLYTNRMKTNKIPIAPKSLVRPETVDIMCIHQVFTFRQGWHRRVVDEDIATLHHYRRSANAYMTLPTRQDNYMLNMSSVLIPVVQERLQKAGMET